MKRSVLVFLLSFVALIGFSQTQKSIAFKVGFYNLENLFDTINNNGKYDLEFSPQGARQWNGTRYMQKQTNMAYVLRDMDVDLLGVAEIENRSVLQDLVNMPEIAHKGYRIVHYDSPDRRGVDVALLYDPKKFKVLATQSRELSITDMPDFKTRDQLVVSGLLGGEKVHVVVNHWPSRLGGEERSSSLREAAAALSKSIADSLLAIDPKAGVIIMGDLNDDPDNKSCRVVLNAKKRVKDVEKGGFYNTMWQFHDKGIGTLAYRGQWNLFDQIIITENLLAASASGLRYWKAEIINKPYLINEEGTYKGYPKRTFAAGVFLNGYSDHLPVMIHLLKEVK